MNMVVALARMGAGLLRYPGTVALCILLAATLLACTRGGDDSATDERVRELDARVHSLEESLEALAGENAELKREVATLRQEQDALEEAHEAAEAEERLAAVEEGRLRTDERLDDLDARLQELEEFASTVGSVFPGIEEWSKGKDDQSSPPESTALERTARLAEDSGGEVYYVDHPERADRSVLVMPLEIVDGETPLIVSLHGYGGDSAYHAAYVPLHERVNTDGFALLLPNGTRDGVGNRFWNPTDQCCDSGKSGEDDVAYLTELVAEAQKVKDFGPVYFFGYSNGGFMSHHMACKGLPGLRAVASLAGTSYIEYSTCDGAPPVSVLHIHGTADEVILFEGDEAELDLHGDGEPAFYAGAEDMVMRWSRRAGCEWPEDPQPYANLDLDQHVPGSETQAFRVESGCAQGISIELWTGVGSSHAPGYGDAFVDALVGWLLSQE